LMHAARAQYGFKEELPNRNFCCTTYTKSG
jgi:hypothetical protein